MLIPHIIDRQINKEIIIRFTHLQETLATGDIIEERRGIVPDTVRRVHIDRGVKQPSRPFGFFRRIRSAVKEHMINAGDEHQVHIRFALRQRSAEMLRQPGKCFGRSIRLPGDMCGRRGIFQHRQVRIILFG